MFIKTLVVQKIDQNGERRTAILSAGNDFIGVNEPEEAQADREIPVYIDQIEYRDEINRILRLEGTMLANLIFQLENNMILINNLTCNNIPIEGDYAFSFYVLLFPKDAILESLSVVGPNNNEYQRYVQRDDERNRYVLYLIPESNLRLNAKLQIDQNRFGESNYSDDYTVDTFYNVGNWQDLMRHDNLIPARAVNDIQRNFEQQNPDGFQFHNGQVFYNGEVLHLPTGRPYEILKKLSEHIQTVVCYQELDELSVNRANDQLRGNISQINKSLIKHNIPYQIRSNRCCGYKLTSTNE